MKVTLLNVKYSPNLGDGIIAECFEHALKQSTKPVEVSSCDLAGRTAYGDGINKSRDFIRFFQSLFPRSIRQIATSAALIALIRARLSKHYYEMLSDSDLILIGGGQLIADNNLNFPRKIRAAIENASNQSAILGIHGAGIAKTISPKGRRLFQQALDGRLKFANVRDNHSLENWNHIFGMPKPVKVWDPGFLISKLYPAQEQAIRSRPVVGIGITNPQTLRLHADPHSVVLSSDQWITFYCDMVGHLQAHGMDIELFTNGAYDDEVFADTVAKAVNATLSTDQRLERASSPKHPKELSEMIAQYDGIIAHRLHANIIAYAYQIPHVGLGWDSKMQGYFSDTDRLEYLVTDVTSSNAGYVGDLMVQALRNPISESSVTAIQKDIYVEVSNLIDICTPD